MKHRSAQGGLVYSTEHGSMCPACRQPLDHCQCRAALPAAGDGIVRVAHESKGRRGKDVTTVRGVPVDAVALAALGKQLRTRCGSGGTVKDGVIEVQGDHRDTVVAWLEAQGYAVKRSGG